VIAGDAPVVAGQRRPRDADGAIAAARVEPLECWQWGRVEVLAADGGRAWSNPFPCPGPAEPYFRDEPA
jgi:hypothetical protein